MKTSKFNLSYSNEDFYILLNTKSRELIRFPLKQKNLVDSILNQKATDISTKIEEVFQEKGFLIQDSENELEDLYKQCRELVNSDILYLTIMPTYTCNFACIYCFQHHIQGAILDEKMMNNIVKAVEQNIGKYKALYVEWFGGEPLLARKQVIYMNRRFKEICNGACIPYAARITTNGYYLDLDTFRQMFKNNCFVYYISIDGDKELHDKQRPCKNGSGSYDVIMKNLKEIQNKITSRNFRIEIRVNCSKKTYDSLERFMFDFVQKFGSDSRFSLIIETINDWSDRTENMSKEGQLLKHADLAQLTKIAKKFDVNLASTDQHLLKTQICQAAKRNAYSIFYDGTIHKCQMAQESKEFCKIEKIGRVTEKGEFEIEYDKEKKWIRDTFPKSCETCKVLPICLGKKCVFQKEIQGQECLEIEKKFLDSFMTYDTSKVENIPLYIIKSILGNS